MDRLITLLLGLVAGAVLYGLGDGLANERMRASYERQRVALSEKVSQFMIEQAAKCEKKNETVSK